MDKYEKVKVLGKGSFGSAILIKRKTDGLLFVVKEVSLMKMSKKERDEARHECTVLQQLQHPNIVRYVEQFENKNNLYIVMEYCDGGDLAGKVKQSRGPMKETSVLYYFSQICLAMEYLHSRHILHRDIKTMNVFLMKNGAVKLGDFGISTVLRNTMGMANTVCGTPYYFSPELCRNRPYNNKSDIWALGVLLYECATGGRHPFDGTSMNQLMQRIVKGNYAPLSSQYSSDFRKMVDWCLQKEPARRPSIKQTLALPLMRQSLEQLEENLMLATQCRVRLKDIIDFESGMDQAQRPPSPQPAPAPQRVAGKEGISPGQAAALALAQRGTPTPAGTPSRAPVSSPYKGAAAAAAGGGAVVGPKPSSPGQQQHHNNAAAAPSRGYDVHHFYNQNQRKPDANPIVAGGQLGGRNATPTTSSPQQSPQSQPHHPPPAEVSPRSNVNLGNNGAAVAAAAQRPTNGAADAFNADMRRVDAIIAKYGKNTDDRAKETIHAYMRRKQEAYMKKQREELENRERRNDLRQRELKRVLENQRAAVSPTNANGGQRESPRTSEPASAHGAHNSPSRRVGSPQARAKSEDRSTRSRSPMPSPSRQSPAGPRSPASAAAGNGGGVFGRDPRRNGGAPPQPPSRSRPTTPQRPATQQRVGNAPPSHRASNAAAVSPKPSANGRGRKVVYAANSPQPGQIDHRAAAAAEARRPQSPSKGVSPAAVVANAEVMNIDWRAIANAKAAQTPSRRKQAPPSAGLDDGVGGHKMVLQSAPAGQARHAQDGGEALRRPSTLAPLANDGHDRRSPRTAMPALSNDLLGRVDNNSNNNNAGDAISPRAAGDPRLQRPSRVHQGYLKPISGRGDDHPSPAQSPLARVSPRPDALPMPERAHTNLSPAVSPRAQAGRAGGHGASPPVELVDIPRSVAANLPPPSASAVPAGGGPVEEALRILRRRRQQPGAAPGVAEVKDLPALNLAPAEVGAGRRPANRHYSDDTGGYAAMAREAVTQDDERFLAEEQQRRHKTESSAVPNTLEALRSLRAPDDKPATADGVSGEVYPVGQLALLKQRQQQRLGGAGNGKGGAPGSAPHSVGQSSDDVWASADPSARQERRPYSSRSSPPPTTSAPVTALSLGDVGRSAPRSASPSTSPKVSQPPSPSAAAHGGHGGSGQLGSMDGYSEMLQHLKDLLQRRRVTRTTGSAASTPTAAAAAQPAARAAPSPASSPPRLFPQPPPLDAVTAADSGGGHSEHAALSPPNLDATKPLHRPRLRPPALDLPGSDEAADAADDDDDFEDAVPLSPVRCAELNDTYARLQKQKQAKAAGRAVPDDVYTDDVDLTAANMEEELDGEEGYTGYYKLPSPQELLKGN